MLIDERGMVGFGKWRMNVIDLAVCVFLLFFLPIFYFGYRLVNKPAPAQSWEQIVKCKYCGYEIKYTMLMGVSPPEEEVERACGRCGKKQMCYFGLGEVKPVVVERVIVDTACQERLERIFKRYPRLRKKVR